MRSSSWPSTFFIAFIAARNAFVTFWGLTLFFAASFLPQLLAFTSEVGSRNAWRSSLLSLLSGSPFFFAFQSRCIGHHVSGEFASGGAAYIATGRGVGLARQPFVALFTSFSLRLSSSSSALTLHRGQW